MNPEKLHIGAGRAYLPGFINVDIFESVHADLYCDMMRLPFDSNSFDLIYCSHCLEHCHRHTIVATLHDWREMLKPGGILRLSVPNFAAVVEWYKKTGKVEDVMGLIYGGQTHPRNNHFVTFDKASMEIALRRAGFGGEIREWDWRTTEHSAFDDYSQAYLPMDPVTRKPLDKKNGLLVSLNMEAVK